MKPTLWITALAWPFFPLLSLSASPDIATPTASHLNSTNATGYARLQQFGVNEIVFAERNAHGEHYYANFGYSCTNPDYWKHGPDGGRLCKLDTRTGQLTALITDPKGGVRDPQVHYDGRRILFSYRKGGTHHYNLYEINADGTGLRQITDGPWDDIEPCYLPDGGIVFSSSRCKRYVACWYTQVAILFRCNPDGSGLRMLSSNTVQENTPCVLPDGRILYTRWEYVNRDPVVFHHLWTMNPDGTGQQVYFGNQHPWDVFIDAQPIRGTDRVVYITSPGHGQTEHAGQVTIVSDASGPDARASVKTITKSADFRDPYPVSSHDFLAARGNQIVLLDEAGTATPLYTGPQLANEPRPLIARTRESVIAPASNLAKSSATLFIHDVHLGRNMEGINRGKIKKLLVLEDLPKPVNYHGGGSTPIGNGGTSTLKRILGTVPVEEDGSARFEVPPLRSIYLALLDENDCCVKQMRSFMTLQPGEQRSCVGCHDSRTQSPNSSRLAPMASQRSSISLATSSQSWTRIASAATIPTIDREVSSYVRIVARSTRSATTTSSCICRSRTPPNRPATTPAVPLATTPPTPPTAPPQP